MAFSTRCARSFRNNGLLVHRVSHAMPRQRGDLSRFPVLRHSEHPFCTVTFGHGLPRLGPGRMWRTGRTFSGQSVTHYTQRTRWSDLTPPPPFGWPSFCWSFLPCPGREATGVSQVPVYLSPCMPRPPTPAGAQHQVHSDAFLLASPCLTGSPPASFMVTRLDIFGRGASHPTACMVPCVCLRHVVRLFGFPP